ncbi:phospholipid carrier-dependent glycosyltransferase [Candidatus Berkelbacteria bacterium]|nr:phospholipid carrier-dependent glycosyltransferase [Candidatus Berkelbacteria bacterium]
MLFKPFDKLRVNWLFWLVVITLVAFGVRYWRITQPPQYIFDEVYYPKYAAQYLAGGAPFDAHPPAGRLLITAGVLLLGNNPFGWRVMPLIFGTLLIPLVYLVGWLLFESRRAGLIAALLIALDGMFFVYARTGLIDTFLVFFTLLTLSLALAARRLTQQKNERLALLAWLASGASIGVATSVKWVGLGIWPIIAAIALITALKSSKKRFIKRIAMLVVSLVAIPAIVYSLFFIVEPGKQPVIWQDIKDWHTHTWSYHINLKETRTYNSHPWQWPLMTKPIHFWNEEHEGTKRAIIALGNPVIWWGAAFAVLGTIVWLVIQLLRQRRKAMLPFGLVVATAGYLVLLLPWLFIKRGLFIFHYLSALAFAILIASYWLATLYKHNVGRKLVIIVLVLAAIAFVYFYPVLSALPISRASYDNRMWFSAWATN